MWLVTTMLDRASVRVLHFLKKASTPAKWIFSPLAFLPLNLHSCRVLDTAVWFLHNKTSPARRKIRPDTEPALGSSTCMSCMGLYLQDHEPFFSFLITCAAGKPHSKVHSC